LQCPSEEIRGWTFTSLVGLEIDVEERDAGFVVDDINVFDQKALP